MSSRAQKERASDLLAQGRYAQAEALFRSLAESEPFDAQLHVRHGDTLRRLNRVDEAVDAYRKASEVFTSLGHLARAIAALRLAIDLKPDDVDLISELIRLEVQKNGRPGPARKAAPEPDLDLDIAVSGIHNLVSGGHPVPVEDDWVDITVSGAHRHSLEVPITEAPATAEWPQVRRLSPREVAVKANPGSPWLVVSSANTVFVRFQDELADEGTEES